VIEALHAHPEVWRTVGDLALQARYSIADALSKRTGGEESGYNEPLRRSIEFCGHDLGKRLAGPSPGPLEQLLVEGIVTCWVELHALEIAIAQRVHFNGGGAMSEGALPAYEERRQRAHRRYLDAIRTLAQVRRLAIPALRLTQVNVGSDPLDPRRP
jgi:hypothetical protein